MTVKELLKEIKSLKKTYNEDNTPDCIFEDCEIIISMDMDGYEEEEDNYGKRVFDGAFYGAQINNTGSISLMFEGVKNE